MIRYVETVLRTPPGIDYTHPAFINADGTSRIRAIWDQSIPFDESLGQAGRIPDGMLYGTEYRREDINLALQSDAPWSVVPSRDVVGHGTFLAGVACGNEDAEKDFSGVAPLADIAVVKCKQAKSNLKNYYGVSTEEPCFMESDIMQGIYYLVRLAYREGKPIVICLGMGTSMGSHYRGGALGQMMQGYGELRGLIMVTAGGNEGNNAGHYRSPVVLAQKNTELELRVGAGETGFTTELWCDAPGLVSVALISPSGEFSGRTYPRLGERREIRFLLEDTTVVVEYLIVSFESGDECIRLNFRNPEEGIWRIRVFNDTDLPLQFDMWLPMRQFMQEGTFFLRPDPNITLCEPSNNAQIISTSYYDASNRGVVAEAGRGFNRRQEIRPDIAAPGVNIYGPLPVPGTPGTASDGIIQEARYGYQSGSSAAAAVTAGAALLLTEWAIVRGNDINLDSVSAQKYLIRGADRQGRDFPNREWGYGTLDLFGVFDRLRPVV